MLKLGVQVSIAGDICNSVKRAKELGINAMQIFPGNPRSFKRKLHSREDIEEFKKLKKATGIKTLVVHAVYTQNLASSRGKFRMLSIKSFIQDLELAGKLGADLIVVHSGSYKGGSYKRGIKNLAFSLDKVLEALPAGMDLLLENVSGSGKWIGSKFSNLAEVIKKVKNPQRLGVCFDTCHAFSAGYDLTSAEGVENLVFDIEIQVGLGKLKLIHLNDSRDKKGSHRDRHYHIGKGTIGKEGVKQIVNHPKLKNIPFILETPKKGENDDIENINRVRELYIDKN